jgi:hypothetical protein
MGNSKLQTLSSRISDCLSSKKKSNHQEVLCAACATLSQDEAIFPEFSPGRIHSQVQVGSLNEVKSRAQDKCPLCQVILHIVTQTLANRQASSLWLHVDLPISLDLRTGKQPHLIVFYDKIAVGKIALWSLSLDFGGFTYQKRVQLSNFKLDIGSLRGILREFFWKYGIIQEFARNIRPFVVIQISQKFGLQTEEYHYYSKISPAAPSQIINHSFVLPALQKCENQRRNRETSPEDVMTEIDIILIDVAQGKLVNAQITSYRYLALSYVWGKVDMMKATLSNVESLRQQGALFALHGQLPRVLQDAMDVTGYLRERCLWCDALCIVHDHADFKHFQIALMGHIYGQAMLTICALSSPDASVGLLGFSEAAPGSLPLDIARSTKNYAYVSSPSNLDGIAHLFPYETRAWTFQERLLSRRCLFF